MYQYFQRRYGLNAISVHWEPDQVPTEKMWDRLEKMLREHPAELMIWEAAPAQETLARLEAMGLKRAIYDPCANLAGAEDFLTVMERNASNLAGALAH